MCKPQTLKSVNSRNAVLDSIFSDTQSSKERWPEEVFESVLKRFKRMPRNGWNLAHEHYLQLFKHNISLCEFKKKAMSTIISSDGRRCSINKFERDPNKRPKILDDFFEEKTLIETKFYNKVKEKFTNILGDIKKKSIEENQRTKKVPMTKLNINLLNNINKIAGEAATTNINNNMTDLAYLYQAAQITYQVMSQSEKKPSVWQSSIQNKIMRLKAQAKLIDKSNNIKALSDKEFKEARKLLREHNLILEKPKDVSECASLINESISVYSKKLNIYESRKIFRKQNLCFELNRRLFYRQLEDKEHIDNNVQRKDIIEYWSTMWTEKSTEVSSKKKEDNGQLYITEAVENLHIYSNDSYCQYLSEFLAESDLKNTFPSYVEFTDIIKYLPNWKACGIDTIYNFFIKKLTSFHEILYEVIRNICLNGISQNSWFYKGITYLIPKGTPTKGSDFRPITCMSNLYKLTTKCVTEVMTLEVESRGLLSENQLGTVRRVQGAKEQALLNIAINKEHGNELKTMWIDVKKAFVKKNVGQ